MATRRERPAPYDLLPLADPDGPGLTRGEVYLMLLLCLTLPIGMFAMGAL